MGKVLYFLFGLGLVSVVFVAIVLRLLSLEAEITGDREVLIDSIEKFFVDTAALADSRCVPDFHSIDLEDVCASVLAVSKAEGMSEYGYCPKVGAHLFVDSDTPLIARTVEYTVFAYSYMDISDHLGVIGVDHMEPGSKSSYRPVSRISSFCEGAKLYINMYRYEKSVWPW